ncbi:hypothetical protein CEP88_14875 [Roseobacter denitrificans]|uniref:hypothetical protein n=1 Tax=Roseobacter denitrificans TaxID=2434 RepID=UPI0005C5A20F|nr:hypothetical protein [Roseobacter denitrificans]AVL53760.1 hypothetical protein CEP88_14875 [Roseobacter denitrificans]
MNRGIFDPGNNPGMILGPGINAPHFEALIATFSTNFRGFILKTIQFQHALKHSETCQIQSPVQRNRLETKAIALVFDMMVST